MSEVITLSSDEEDFSRPLKKRKLSTGQKKESIVNEQSLKNSLSTYQHCAGIDVEETGLKQSYSDILKHINSLQGISATLNKKCKVSSIENKPRDEIQNSLSIIIEDESPNTSKKQDFVRNNVIHGVEIKESSPKTKDESLLCVVEIEDDNVQETEKAENARPDEICTIDISDENLDSVMTNSAEDSTKDPAITTEALEVQSTEDGERTDPKHSILNEKMVPEVSSSKSLSTSKIFDEFLTVCADSVKGSSSEDRVMEKFPKLRNYFTECEHLHDNSVFVKTIEKCTGDCKISTSNAIVSFATLYKYLRESASEGADEIPVDIAPKVKKLQHFMKLLCRKLKKLEDAEVDLDDEHNSSLLQMERYTNRLHRVYLKYCQLLNKNPHSGRLTYGKISFCNSNHDEINRAITKFCKNNKFPSYYDIESIVKKCANKYSMSLTDAQIRHESTTCFEKLGSLLQLRRKRELYDSHSSFMDLSDDPAMHDSELNLKLKNSAIQGEAKMKEVLEKYVKLQENNTDTSVSEDSDDSNYQDSSPEDDV